MLPAAQMRSQTYTFFRGDFMRNPLIPVLTVLVMAVTAAIFAADIKPGEPATPSAPLAERLKAVPFKIAWDAYANGNSDIWVMNADGSNKVNLTQTPDENEHYPQVSPDGTKIAYTIDVGEGRDAVRSLWVMDIHGKNRRKIADHAREPFWRRTARSSPICRRSIPSLT